MALKLEAAILPLSARFTKAYKNYSTKTLNFHNLYLVVIKAKKALNYNFEALKTKPTQLESLILSLKTFKVDLSKIEQPVWTLPWVKKPDFTIFITTRNKKAEKRAHQSRL